MESKGSLPCLQDPVLVHILSQMKNLILEIESNTWIVLAYCDSLEEHCK